METIDSQALGRSIGEFLKSLALDADYAIFYRDYSPGSRTDEFQAARVCEKAVREQLGADCLLSLSHTGASKKNEGKVLCLGVRANQVRKIGIDIEFAERKTNPRLSQRMISTPEEVAIQKSFGLSALDFWVVKEAAFKANPHSQGSVVSQYRIEKFDGTKGSVRSPQLELLPFLKLVSHGISLAVAVCRY